MQNSSPHTIKEKADRRYGGPTTTWKLSHQVKLVCQRFDVGDLITVESTRSKGVKIVISSKLEKRLNGRFYDFYKELLAEAEECGYSCAAGDDYLLLDRV